MSKKRIDKILAKISDHKDGCKCDLCFLWEECSRLEEGTPTNPLVLEGCSGSEISLHYGGTPGKIQEGDTIKANGRTWYLTKTKRKGGSK